jgi:hypothetical protein
MQSILGKSDKMVGHATTPFEFGLDAGGAPDIVYFRNYVPGVVAVTCELIGDDDQIPNALGNYELAICRRAESDWGNHIIKRLAYYTLQTPLEPGQTMDIGSGIPAGSTISAVLFTDFGRFVVRGRRAGILLCLGITREELAACRQGRGDSVEAALKYAGVYPFTDLNRKSVSLDSL